MSLICKMRLTIGRLVVEELEQFAVTLLPQSFGYRCKVHLPYLHLNRQAGLEPHLTFDAPMQLDCWYEGYPVVRVFDGWVRQVSPNVPLVVEGDTVPWALQSRMLRRLYNDYVGVERALRDCVAGTGVDIRFENVPALRFNKLRVDQTRAVIIHQICQYYGLDVRTEAGQVVVRPKYWSRGQEVIYDTAENVSATELVYRTRMTGPKAVKAIGFRPDGDRLVETVGEQLGVIETHFFYNVQDRDALRKLAEAKLKMLTQEGYTGFFTGWLYPVCMPGDTVLLRDRSETGRVGKYRCDDVTLTFGTMAGFERRINLGLKLANLQSIDLAINEL